MSRTIFCEHTLGQEYCKVAQGPIHLPLPPFPHSPSSWSTGEGSGKPLQHSCLENPMNSVKRQNSTTLKDEPFRSVGVQYATGEEWRNSTTRNEEPEPKWKRQPTVVVSGGESKIQCCKERYCVRNWNVRPTNQGRVELVKQELARVNRSILGISALTWTRMGELNSDDHYTTVGKNLRKIGVALIVNRTVPNAELGAASKMREWSQFVSKQNIQHHSNPSLYTNH